MCGEVPEQSTTAVKRQSPPHSQPVHPAAIWKEIQKYPLLYHQTTGQLLPLSCETSQPILCTQTQK